MSAAQQPGTMLAFLFTDIAGSTGLWEAFPVEMERAYDRHDSILRTAAANHGGIVFKVIGDAFQIAFPDPGAALAATIAAQCALVSEEWPLPEPLRIRMALHAGAIAPDSFGDYRSPILNRLGRLLAAGHGGQILLSAAMTTAVQSALPAGYALRDLGRRRLRDFPEPESIAQATGPGLPDQFPPLRTLEPRRFNLPALSTPIVGRTGEIEQVTSLLHGGVRLVTLTGPGGAGKTRLAIEAATRMRDDWFDGVVMVDLAPITDPALLLPQIAETVGVRPGDGQTPGEALTAWLADRELLLLLDNFEQIVDAAPELARLLAVGPKPRLLVTSREALRLRAEEIVPVDLLPLPDPEFDADPAIIAQSDSVALFVERARAVSPSFAITPENAGAIAAICRQVEGLPLAIELAAARVRALSPAALLARLSRRLDLLSGGARDLPDRHQTLRATIAWSYELLLPDDRALFRALGVFVGGAGLDAAAWVVGEPDSFLLLDRLIALVDKHLLRQDDRDGEPRFAMMETVRAFALESLREAGEEEVIRRRHAEWFHRWAVSTPDLTDGTGLDRLQTEHGNLRAALQWATASGEPDLGLELAGALAPFWHLRGHLSDGRAFLAAALAAAPETPTAARLTALREAGTLISRGDIDQAETLFTESLEIATRAGDRRRIAIATGNLGAVAHYRGDLDTTLARYRASLAIRRELHDTFGIATMLVNLLSLLAPFPEHHEEARAYGEESLRAYTVLGDHQGKGYALGGLGLIAEARGDSAAARNYYEQSLAQFQAAEDPSGIARALGNLGSAALALGELARAAALFRECLRSLVELEERDSVANLLDQLAAVAVQSNEPLVAARLMGAAGRLRTEIGVSIPFETRDLYERTLTALRAALGERALEDARQRGSETAVDEAVLLACTFPVNTPGANVA